MSLPFLVYDIIIRVYALAVRIASPFNPKARKWVQGRNDWEAGLRKAIPAGGADIWMHCASLGEFEQGRAVLEALRKNQPEAYILVTFFSPSGYEVRRNYPGADHVCYLPLDTRKNARLFVSLVHPRLVLFVKYEFWFHFLTVLHKRKIPILLISAIFRPTQFFFRPYGRPFRPLLSFYRRIFAQDAASLSLLEKAGVTGAVVSGDTRLDRVLEIAARPTDLAAVTAFVGGKSCCVAGSTWPRDEQLLHQCRRSFPRWIIAPHEIDESRLQGIERLFAGETVRYSALSAGEQKGAGASVLIMDNIGMLSALYRVGETAYVGGGFDHGIHNVAEAAVYGVPVIFGPDYSRFREATDLVSLGAAYSVATADELQQVLDRLGEEAFRARAGAAAKSYILREAGATADVVTYIQENRFFTR
jgi:3-deoxy-D-manno-octulosonic-acid transferase